MEDFYHYHHHDGSADNESWIYLRTLGFLFIEVTDESRGGLYSSTFLFRWHQEMI